MTKQPTNTMTFWIQPMPMLLTRQVGHGAAFVSGPAGAPDAQPQVRPRRRLVRRKHAPRSRPGFPGRRPLLPGDAMGFPKTSKSHVRVINFTTGGTRCVTFASCAACRHILLATASRNTVTINVVTVQVSRQADIPCAQARLNGIGNALEGFARCASAPGT